jgi:hypothetical protein
MLVASPLAWPPQSEKVRRRLWRQPALKSGVPFAEGQPERLRQDPSIGRELDGEA